MARLQAVLADPDLYARDRGRFRPRLCALEKAAAELAAAEERWLELELLREEVEGR